MSLPRLDSFPQQVLPPALLRHEVEVGDGIREELENDRESRDIHDSRDTKGRETDGFQQYGSLPRSGGLECFPSAAPARP